MQSIRYTEKQQQSLLLYYTEPEKKIQHINNISSSQTSDYQVSLLHITLVLLTLASLFETLSLHVIGHFPGEPGLANVY